MTDTYHQCPFVSYPLHCNVAKGTGSWCSGCTLLIEPVATTEVTSTVKPCAHTGYYHTVTFLCFKRKFLACENCGTLIPQGGWRFNI